MQSLSYCYRDWHNSELFTFLLVWIAQLVGDLILVGELESEEYCLGFYVHVTAHRNKFFCDKTN